MNLKLTKSKILWIGFGIIGLYYFLNKIDFMIHASFTDGKAVRYTTIQFEENLKLYEFTAVKNVHYLIGEKVPVIFLSAHPETAYVYSFFGFWYYGILYSIIPILVWAAFVLAFVDEEAKFYLSFLGKRKSSILDFERKKLNN
ncbi:MAG: hypothetical protein IPP32_09830 [Bacteroidetes bacterium]|nr:hypothetical protein [Bacteroidota bacterium]